MNMPTVSVVMPVYNTAKYVTSAVKSVLAQTYSDFELLIIDDAGTDNAIALCRRFEDPRIRIISQENRGLAGARNTGIRNARGDYIAFLDSDDLWAPTKLARHVAHLKAAPSVGVSYAGSCLIDDHGHSLRITQSPKLKGITARDIFLRNPIGNGSAPVIRREVFDDIAAFGRDRLELDFFDESFRQSEDIECWCRIALTTHWRFEGVKGALTYYRINEGGLSANVVRQFTTWLRVRAIVKQINPRFERKWGAYAEAYQLRYLARRCIRMGDGTMAWSLIRDAIKTCPKIILQEPAKSTTTIAAALMFRFLPTRVNMSFQTLLQKS